ncbi:MAG: PLP-dependent aminotransferase family protein [Proteobacteria bacterium]|nr:PLP-dependent aminotransferase family protein [Pseudomonadota bacterium]
MVNYSIDKESDTPLYIQIRDVIQEAIRLGELNPGDKLPSVTSLAKEIGVTQATVRRALQDLSDAGQACCHVGRGTFIQNPTASETSLGEFRENRDLLSNLGTSNPSAAHNPLEYAARRLRMGVGKALRDIMSLADKPGIIHLTKGVPDPNLLPEKFLEEIISDTLADKTANLLEATDPLGRYELRAEIAQRFSAEGTPVSPEQVLITNGSIQGVTLLAQENREIGRRVLCETPCFKGITDTFASMGHWVETITRDGEGPTAELLHQLPNGNPYLLYLCPYSHNPMGTHLSEERRGVLVDWAKKTGSTIIADELFKDLSWADNNPHSLMKDLGPDQTVVVSSLSKSIMTGLRIGWIISSPQRIQQLAQLKRLNDHSCPTLIQGLALTIFKSGRFTAHTRKMAAIYQRRQETMLKALERFMPKEVSWTRPDGGFSLLLKLPRGYSSVALFLFAIDKGVAFLPGPLFDIDQRFVNCCRISYAWSDEAEIKEGIELLASAVEDFIRRPPGDSGLSGLGSYQ